MSRAAIILVLLALSGCYTDQQQFDFAKRCIDAGLLPFTNSSALQCRPIETAK